MKAIELALLALSTGCAYGPEHLDSLYLQRNSIQSEIDNVETRSNIPSRDPEIRRQREEAHQALLKAAAARSEAEKKAIDEKRAADAAKEAEEKEFLASLTPPLRLQWMMHLDQVAQDKEHQAAAARKDLQDREFKKEMDRKRAWRQALMGTPTVDVNVNN
jgi:hypothetical protein